MSMKTIYNIIFFIVLAICITACSVLRSTKDVVLWAPKKTIEYSGKAWDSTGGAILKKPNDWQKNLVFGERRAPIDNPSSAMGSYSQPPANPYVNRSAPAGAGGISPYSGGINPSQSSPPPYTNNIPSYPSPSTNSRRKSDFQPYATQGDTFDYPPVLQQYQPPQGGKPSAPTPYGGYPSPANSSSSSAPYDMMDRDYAPYPPTQNKLIRKFEPMAAEGISPEENASNKEYQPLDLQTYMNYGKIIAEKTFEKNENTIKIAANAPDNNIFPLEEYTPKSDVVISKMGSDKTAPIEFKIQKLDSEYTPPAVLPAAKENNAKPTLPTLQKRQIKPSLEGKNTKLSEPIDTQITTTNKAPIAKIKQGSSQSTGSPRFLRKSRYNAR